MDKDLQADINKLSKFVKLYTLIEETDAALDRIIARIPDHSWKEDCVFKNCEFYNEATEGHCNGECCDGSAQEHCEWYEYLQKDREISKPKPKPAPDFDAIAREIEEKAYQSGTFFPALCAQILRKHFGKED